MAIIQLLHSCKSVWHNYLNAKKYRGIKSLKKLLKEQHNLKAITVEREAVILELTDDIRFEWDIQEPYHTLLVLDEDYELLERQIIKNILKAEDTVFDIGANFGYFSVLMKKFCPTIDLYAFEPIKNTYKMLLRNLNHNKLGDVKSYEFGFADEDKEVLFHIPDQLGSAWASMGTGVANVHHYKLKKQLAKVCRLDDFVEANKIDRIDFIKCDVEGAEKLVVEGARESLKRDCPTMMLEIGDMWTASFGYNRMLLIQLIINDFGYKCFGVLGNRLIPLMEAGEVAPYPEEKMYNYFFVHPSRADVMALILNHLSMPNLAQDGR